MNQSAILRASYEEIYKNLSALSEETKLFVMCDKYEDALNETRVILGVSDICQLSSDKNGEKVEENGMIYEAPTMVGCVFSLSVISKSYPSFLETAGLLIQYFKDNNYIQLEDYKWHGENDGKIFIEPIVRKPELRVGFKERYFTAFTFEYLMEIGINSQKGTSYKRVERIAIKGGTINK
jgi:hypothetical protein